MSDVGRLLGSAEGLLLDFDGPICDLFATYRAWDIANELRSFLQKHVPFPEQLPVADDPLELLRWTAHHHPSLTRAVEDLQSESEYAAAESARPTDFAQEVLQATGGTVGVAIVSNNSAEAIRRYLDLHQIHVDTVIGRTPAQPHLLKPHPASVLRAAHRLNVSPGECVLVGDSPSDIEAAREAQVASIGYAKRPDRVSELSDADVVTQTMEDVATALRLQKAVR